MQIETKCAALCAHSVSTFECTDHPLHISTTELRTQTLFVVLSAGHKNIRLVQVALQCDIDKQDRHWAAHDHYKTIMLNDPTRFKFDIPTHVTRIVLTGFGIGGTIAEYVASDLQANDQKRQIEVVTFASPRGGGRKYYRLLRYDQAMNIIHHDWLMSYPPKICGFYVKRRTLWDGRQFRAMGQTVVPSTSIVSEKFRLTRKYFNEMEQLMKHIYEQQACDPIINIGN